MRTLWVISALCILVGCGRYFAGPLRPLEHQGAYMTVRDDGSVSYALDRLEVILRPLSDEQLNRQFAAHSSHGGESTNPYTYGDWKPLGDNWIPPRFTVFWLKVKNYAYPKMQVDPYKAILTSTNRRRYRVLRFSELSDYYQAFALGQAGNAWARLEERRDLLKKTMYAGDILFSGQEDEGYIVFPELDYDVKEISVTLGDIALGLDYENRPLKTMDLTFHFQRDVYRGYHPPPLLTKSR